MVRRFPPAPSVKSKIVATQGYSPLPADADRVCDQLGEILPHSGPVDRVLGFPGELDLNDFSFTREESRVVSVDVQSKPHDRQGISQSDREAVCVNSGGSVSPTSLPTPADDLQKSKALLAGRLSFES